MKEKQEGERFDLEETDPIAHTGVHYLCAEEQTVFPLHESTENQSKSLFCVHRHVLVRSETIHENRDRPVFRTC